MGITIMCDCTYLNSCKWCVTPEREAAMREEEENQKEMLMPYYEAGREAFKTGVVRSRHGLYGDELAAWQNGWDDAEEEAADATEAEICLPVVAGGAA